MRSAGSASAGRLDCWQLGDRQLQLVQRVRRPCPRLSVGLRQRDSHLRQPRRQLEDALVDGDRLGQEALPDVDLGGAQVDVARLGERAVADVDLGHLQPGAGVGRVLLDDARELLEGAVVLPPLQELLCRGEMLVFLRQHRPA